jgi:hypothetical protein
VACLLKAIDIYTDMGRFSIAAKHHQSIAEMYEGEANDLVSSLTWKKCGGKINKTSIDFFFLRSIAPFSTTSKQLTISRAKSQQVRPISAC